MSSTYFSRCLATMGRAGTSLVAGALLLVGLPATAFSSDLVNLFMQGFAGTGEDRMETSFIVAGPGPTRVAAFAFTPTGVAGGLEDPRLVLVNVATGRVLGSNDNWPDSADADEIGRIIASTGIDINNRAAAVIIELSAGAYVALVDGADGGTGIVAAGVADLEDDHSGGGDSATGPCTGQEVELPLVNTGVIGGAKGKARVRTYADCGQDLRVEIEDVPVGDYGLRVAGQVVGTIKVVNTGFENAGQIEFDDEANDPHELPLTFDPSGLMEVTQGATVILSRDFPSLQ
jgi:hypothetical protein